MSQDTFANFGTALANWRDPKLPAGPPRRKTKRKTPPSYCAALGADTIRYNGHRSVRLPVIGWVRLAEPLPRGYIPYEARIFLRHDSWYVSFQVWKPPVTQPERESQTYGGADVGSRKIAVDSLGNEYANPKPLLRAQRKLRNLNRELARRTPGGKRATPCRRKTTSNNPILHNESESKRIHCTKPCRKSQPRTAATAANRSAIDRENIDP